MVEHKESTDVSANAPVHVKQAEPKVDEAHTCARKHVQD